MRPIKLLRGLLTQQATSTSDELDDEQGSLSRSWLLLSNSNDENVTPTRVTTADQGCQTQPDYMLTSPKPRSTIRPFVLLAHKLLFHHQPSYPSPNSLASTMVVLNHQTYIALDHHLLQKTLLLPTKTQYFWHLLPNHCLLQQHSARHQQPYNPQPKKMKLKLLEHALGSWIYFTTFVLHPNSFQKFTLQLFWNNTSIELQTA